jgi:Na+:H+ antiporter, NhaA family
MRKKIRDFLQLESASGIILLAAAILALLAANSPFSQLYQQFSDGLHFYVNEGLMAIFFLMVGLELKRGFVEGKRVRAGDILLPLAAAAGGMAVPAAIYLLFNSHDPVTTQGFAIPVATDIAFAIGVLTMFGNKVPRSLKLFLLSIAIYDDLGAIIIIAIFYTQHLAFQYLVFAGLTIFALLLVNAFNLRSLAIYLMGGVLLWVLFLKAGIHPTLAGVVTAMLIPEIPYRGETQINYLEKLIHPYVAFGIMPLFALINAGLPLQSVSFSMLFDTVTIGIILGLFVGKQVGVMGVTWLSIRTTRWARLPAEIDWLSLYAVALLCGIGFTMSLFLGNLSFQGNLHYMNEVRLGVILGSLLSGLAGASIMMLAIKRKTNEL